MTDPVAEMLTSIRNGIQSRAESVDVPSTKLNLEIARILKKEGYILGHEVIEKRGKSYLHLQLKTPGQPRRVVVSGPMPTKTDVKRVINFEKFGDLNRAYVSSVDLYEKLRDTVNRSLDLDV